MTAITTDTGLADRITSDNTLVFSGTAEANNTVEVFLNDGSGAVRAIRRIAGGYPFREIQEAVIARGEIQETDLQACRDLGMALALGLSMGVF